VPDPIVARKSTESSSGVKRAVHMLIGWIRFDLQRQWSHPGITLLSLVRVIFAVGLITSAAFFSDAVERVILDRLLSDLSQVTGRPPFSTLAYTFPSASKPLSLGAAEKLTDHIAGTLASEVHLPVKHVGLRVGSGAMSLEPGERSDSYDEGKRSLGVVSLVYINDVGEHIDVIAGQALGPGVSGDALEVWMPAGQAAEMGVQVGDEFLVSAGPKDFPLPLTVAGIWQARDPTEPFWYSDPETSLTNALLVRRG
jgi:hypothetical protein